MKKLIKELVVGVREDKEYRRFKSQLKSNLEFNKRIRYDSSTDLRSLNFRLSIDVPRYISSIEDLPYRQNLKSKVNSELIFKMTEYVYSELIGD